MKRVSLVTVIMASTLVACQKQPVRTAASMSVPSCAGDDYVEVTNNTGKAVEVYANVGASDGQYIGTMPTDSTHLSLTGTAAQGKNAAFYATVDGIKYAQGDSESPVQLIRRCGRRLGPTPH